MSRLVLSKLTRGEVTRIFLGCVAFLIYACATLLSNQNVQSVHSYAIERTGMASAISNVVYGAPVATVYWHLFNDFEFSQTPLNELIQKAESKQIEPGALMPYVPDGIGIGQAVFTTVAMRIFGIHPRSIVLLFLCLMGVTTLAFLARFHDERSIVIFSVFMALTIMFASPLGTDAFQVTQIPAGGHRYFSLLAAIPGVHIFLELIDSVKNSVLSKSSLRLLALQSLVFMITYLMNIATVYIFGPLLLFAIYSFIATPRAQGKGILYGKILVVVGTVISLLVIFALLTPRAYRDTGRAQPETTWHHVMIGFGTNPNWPFGNLADVYRGCWPGKPNDSLVAGLSDFNGGCVWAAYAKRNGLSEDQMGKELYDKSFDVATREAALSIFRQYPLQTFVTFVYYKPLAILHTLYVYFHFKFPATFSVSILIICQMSVFLVFAALNRNYLSSQALMPVYFWFGLTAIAASGLYIIAYSSPLTSVDLFFNMLAFIGAVGAGLTAAAFRSFLPSTLFDADSIAG